MAISLVNTPGWGAGPFTADATLTLATHAAGDRIVVLAIWKDFSITAQVSGWTEIIEQADGNTSSGTGTGSVKIGMWYKDATSSSETNPTVDFSTTTGLLAFCTHYVLRKDASETWDTPLTLVANWPAQSSGTVVSTNPADIKNGALVLAAIGIRDDSATFTRGNDALDDDGSPAMTWSGNYVEAPATHAQTTTGNDLGGDAGYRIVTTGANGVNLQVTATLSASETGFIVWLIQGVTGANDKSGTLSTTGGGTVTYAANKQGLRSSTETGGGTVAWARTADHRPAFQYTGGGTIPLARTSERSRAQALTGGGTVSEAPQKGALRVQTLTGGGTVTTAGEKAAQLAYVLTGGGTVVIAYEVESGGSVTGTLVLTGGGLVQFAASSDRLRSLSLTGAGTVTSTAAKQANALLAATGGGLVVLDVRTARSGVATVVGSGTVVSVAVAGRLVDYVLTGGGTVAFIGTAEEVAIIYPDGHRLDRTRNPNHFSRPQGRRRPFRRWW